MGQTLANYDAMLKEFYLPEAIDALPDMVEMYDEVKRTSKGWTGNKIIEPVRLSRNVGKGARAVGGTMPTPGYQTTEEHQIQAKYNYQTIQLSGQVMKASANTTGAFAKAMTYEMSMAMKDITNDIDRQLLHDGVGNIGVILSGTSSATQTLEYAGAASGSVSRQPGTRFLQVGDLVLIGTATEHGFTGAPEVATVSSITDRNTVVFSASESTVTADIVCFGAAANAPNTNYNNEIQGVEAAMITSGAYQNINHANFKANVLNNPAGALTNRSLTTTLMQQAVDEPWDNAGSKVDLIYGHTSMRMEYLDLMYPDRRYNTGKNMDAGYTGELSFNDIRMKFFRNAPYNILRFLNRGTWTLYHLGGMLHWFDLDGSVLSRVSGVDAVDARLQTYCNLGCNNPRANCALNDITVTLRAT